MLSDFLKYEEITLQIYLLTAGGIFAFAVLMVAAMVYKFAVNKPNAEENTIRMLQRSSKN